MNTNEKVGCRIQDFVVSPSTGSGQAQSNDAGYRMDITFIHHVSYIIYSCKFVFISG